MRGDIMKRDIERGDMHAVDDVERSVGEMHAADNGARRSENNVGGGVSPRKMQKIHSASSGARGRAVRGMDKQNGRGGAARVRSASQVALPASHDNVRNIFSIALIFFMVFCLTLGVIFARNFIADAATVRSQGTQWVSFETDEGGKSLFNETDVSGFYYQEKQNETNNSEMTYKNFQAPSGLFGEANNNNCNRWVVGYIDFTVDGDPSVDYLVKGMADVALFAASGDAWADGGVWAHAGAKVKVTTTSQNSTPADLLLKTGDSYTKPRGEVTNLYGSEGHADGIRDFEEEAPDGKWTMMYTHGKQIYKHFGIGAANTGLPARITSGNSVIFKGGQTARIWLGMFVGNDQAAHSGMAVAVCSGMGYTFAQTSLGEIVDSCLETPTKSNITVAQEPGDAGHNIFNANDHLTYTASADTYYIARPAVWTVYSDGDISELSWVSNQIDVPCNNNHSVHHYYGGANFKPSDYTIKAGKTYGIQCMGLRRNASPITYRLSIPITLSSNFSSTMNFSADMISGIISRGHGTALSWGRIESVKLYISAYANNSKYVFESPTPQKYDTSKYESLSTKVTYYTNERISFDTTDIAQIKSNGNQIYFHLEVRIDKDNPQNSSDSWNCSALETAAFLSNIKITSAIKDETKPFQGLGTDENPYKLTNRTDFDVLRRQVNTIHNTFANKKFIIKPYSGSEISFTPSAATKAQQAFTPIGNSETYSFKGSIDGQGNTLDNIYIRGSANEFGYCSALFGYVVDASFENIKLTDVDISSTKEFVGGLIGAGFNRITVSNCEVSGTIVGKAYVGGLIGAEARGSDNNQIFTIDRCTNNASVTSNLAASIGSGDSTTNKLGVGGIIGLGANAFASITITHCVNNGKIKTVENHEQSEGHIAYGTGGIVGYADPNGGEKLTIENCTNKGYIHGAAAVGGIIGFAVNGTIKRCKNLSQVYSSKGGSPQGIKGGLVGGIVGYADMITASNCYNSGTVGYLKSTDSETTDMKNLSASNRNTNGGHWSGNVNGGIAGFADDTTFAYCYNSGFVYGYTQVGGIVGYAMNSSSLSYCYVDGAVNFDDTGRGSYGAFVGETNSTVNITGSWKLINFRNQSNSNEATFYDKGKKIGNANAADQIDVKAGPAIYESKDNIQIKFDGYDDIGDWTAILYNDINAVKMGQTSYVNGTYLYATSTGTGAWAYYTPQATYFGPEKTPEDTAAYLILSYSDSGDTNIYTPFSTSIVVKQGKGIVGNSWEKVNDSGREVLKPNIEFTYGSTTRTNFDDDEGYIFEMPTGDRSSDFFDIEIEIKDQDGQTVSDFINAGEYHYTVKYRLKTTSEIIGTSGWLKGTITIHPLIYRLDKNTAYNNSGDIIGALLSDPTSGKYVNEEPTTVHHSNEFVLFNYVEKNQKAASYVYNFPPYGDSTAVGLERVAFWQVSEGTGIWFEFRDQSNLESLTPNDYDQPHPNPNLYITQNIQLIDGSLIRSDEDGAGNNCYAEGHTIYIGPDDPRVQNDGYYVGYYYYVAFETKKPNDTNVYFTVGTGDNKQNVNRLEILYRIPPRTLTLTSTPENWDSIEHTFTYNRDKQGITNLALSNFATGQGYANLQIVDEETSFTRTSTLVGGPTDVDDPTVEGDNIKLSAINEGNYAYTFTLSDKGNYMFGYVLDENDAPTKQPDYDINYTWTINPKSIEADDVKFAYGAGGIVAGDSKLTTVGSQTLTGDYFGLYASTSATFDEKYALVFMDDQNVFRSLEKYVLLWEYGDNPNPAGDGALRWLNYMSEGINFAFATSEKYITSGINYGATLQDNDETFSGALGGNTDVTYVYIKLTGEGNFEGELYVRFALMKSDFGFVGSETPGWGSEDNPYVLQNEAHFLRLSQIVNGAPAWNSINSSDKTVALENNEQAVATSRDYAGTFFTVDAIERVTGDSPHGIINLSTAHGFEPIGHINGAHNISESNQKFPFKATLNGGNDAGAESGNGSDGQPVNIINLTIGSSDEDGNYVPAWGKAYVGLFGYVSGEYDSENGTHSGAHIFNLFVSGAIYTTANYVGAIAGFAENAKISGKVVARASINNVQSQLIGESSASGGEYTGGAIGYMKGGEVAYDDAQFLATRLVTGSIEGFRRVGGIFGLLEGVKFAVDGEYKPKTVFTNVMGADVIGSEYVGGIAGEWYIHAPAVSQTEGEAEGSRYVNFVNLAVGDENPVNITGKSFYVGGVAGYLHDFDIVTSSNINNHTVTDGAYIVAQVNATIEVGWSYRKSPSEETYQGAWDTFFVGGLFGALEGNGFAYLNGGTSGTKVIVDPSKISITVNVQSTEPYAVGGLFGYVGGAGVLFDGDLTVGGDGKVHILQTETYPSSSIFENKFIGGVAGAIGINATLEGASNQGGSINRTITASQPLSGSFVGGIAGFVAYSAGAKTADGYVFGNAINMKNTANINAGAKTTDGGNFIGGLFGAMGYVNVADMAQLANNLNSNLKNLLTLGDIGGSAASTGFTFGGASLVNTGDIVGSNYVGGLIGYVGEDPAFVSTRTVLSLINPQIEADSAAEDLKVYVKAQVNGKSNVGGLIGYVGDAAHSFVRMYFEGNVTASGEYAGGLFGNLQNGRVQNSVAIASTNPDASRTTLVNSTGNYAGGIAGYLDGNFNIDNSFTMGFQFDTSSTVSGVSPTRGGIVGGIGTGAGVTASWTFYYASSADGKTTSPNQKGKYVLIDKDLRNVSGTSLDLSLTGKALMAMAGIISATSSGVKDGNGVTQYNPATEGHVSFAAAIPVDNKQIALYEANGKGQTTRNSFEVLTNGDNPEITASESNRTYSAVYFKFNATTSNSMLVLSEDIVYKDMQSNADKKGQSGVAVAYSEAKKSYYPPAYDIEFYTVQTAGDESTITYTYGSKGEVTHVDGTIYCTKGTAGSTVDFGYLNKGYTPGEKESPYIIATKQDWVKFAEDVRNGNPYTGQFVKQTADIAEGIGSLELAGTSVLSGTTYSYSSFSGTYDGDGHSLTLALSGTVANGSSLFPYASGATFKNLTVKGTIDGSTTGAHELAAFVGLPTGDITFENCVNEADISAGVLAGGFVSRTGNNTVKMISCVNKGAITSKDDANRPAANASYNAGGTGGLIGLVEKSMTVESCKNEGAVTGGFNVGGLVGGVFIHDNPTSGNVIDINVYNSGNTGEVVGHSGYGKEEDSDHNTSMSILKAFNYTGGLIGKTGAKAKLTMLASYNSGHIVAYGNVVGGLVGGVGNMEYTSSGDIITQGGKSVIAYSYNSGKVEAGGTKTKTIQLSDFGSLKQAAGTVAGGIAGSAGWIDVNYCYNTGELWAHGLAIIYTGTSWQDGRMIVGGMIGQSEPVSKNVNGEASAPNKEAINFNYCYNVGLLIGDWTSSAVFNAAQYGRSGIAYNAVWFGGGITGHISNNQNRGEITRVGVNNCYVLKGCLVRTENAKAQNFDVYSNGSYETFNANSNSYTYTKCAAIGADHFVTLDALTAVMGEGGQGALDATIMQGLNGGVAGIGSTAETLVDGNGNDVTTEQLANGTLPGYIFIPGCLPQLAVFALDTKEGLSMLSTSYGRKSYGDFTTDYVGEIAGSEYSPYIVKDGIDLMGLSALVNSTGKITEGRLYHHFDGKYIEIAKGANNIDGVDVARIDMKTYKYATSAEDPAAGEGKSYHLYGFSGNSVACYRGNNTTKINANSITMRSEGDDWANKNTYFDGGAYAKGYNTGVRNFLPIGIGDKPYNPVNDQEISDNYFAGNFDGRGATIANLKVVQADENRAYAGLFGKVQQSGSASQARVAGVTLTGASVKAYLTSATSDAKTGAVAGGIVAWLGGGTTVESCTVGGTILSTLSTALTSAGGSSTYVGGIAGLITSATAYSGDTSNAHADVTVQNCSVIGADISGWGINIGGIAGIAAGEALAHVNGVTSSSSGAKAAPTAQGDIYIQGLLQHEDGKLLPNTVGGGTTLKNVPVGSLAHDHAGGGIGGIVGVTNGDVNVTVSSSRVGFKGEGADDGAVTITGTHMVGGIVGRSNGNTTIGIIDGAGVTVGAGTTINITTPTNDGQHTDEVGTAIGGIVGYAVQDTVFVHVTFGGTLSVGGTVPASNIGGVVGYMGEGSAFYNGASVDVNGTISINVSTTETDAEHNKNIGGVIGYTKGASIRGTFSVTPVIGGSDDYDAFAINVGGFIGNVDGPVYISSFGEETTIDISPKGAIGSPKITGGKVVGGFAGNVSEQGGVHVGVKPNSTDPCDGKVTINIGDESAPNGFTVTALDLTTDDNKDKDLPKDDVQFGNDVGGFIGRNSGTLRFTKGTMANYATVIGYSDVGGIIGHNSGEFTVGGEMTLENYGNVGISDSMKKEYNATESRRIGRYIGGIIGKLERGDLVGKFTNYGSVTGIEYVGGSIGVVGTVNVATGEITAPTQGAIGGEARDIKTVFTNYGTVEGVQYVGGSIGWMNGNINGTQQNFVEFVNTTVPVSTGSSSDALVAEGDGVADSAADGTGQLRSPQGMPANYFGGAIGVLNGNATYARFANSVAMTIFASADGGLADEGQTGGGSWGIGGSIGVIGKPNSATGTTINVENCQFEFFHMNNTNSEARANLTIVPPEGDIADSIIANGVGGAIGIIAPDVTFAESNNFFLGGAVIAPRARFVGGAVGLIRANDVKIEDVLIFSNVVKGADYVGGVVGSVGWVDLREQSNTPVVNEGLRVSIQNSFNLTGTVISKGEAANRGGIVGYTQADTDASTSYWVVDKLHATDGTETDKVLTSDYIQEIVDSDRWTSGTTGEMYNTGSEEKGWYFMFAQDSALIMPGDMQTDGVHTKADDAPGVNIFHEGFSEDAAFANILKRFPYWQAIAGMKTFNQLNNPDKEDLNPVLSSFIIGKEAGDTVTSGGAPQKGYIYVAASAGIQGKYLTVSSTYNRNFVKYLHNTAGAEQPSTSGMADTIVGENTVNQYVPEGGFGYTYIAVNVAAEPGNVAVYYRDVVKNDGSEGFVASVTANTAPYSGSANTVEIPLDSYPEFSNKDMRPLEAGGTKGHYAYKPYLTTYRAIGAAEAESIDSNAEIINSGFYEGYLNIYLYDEHGTPKAVGSVLFGMEVAPREVQLVLDKTPHSAYVGTSTDATDDHFGNTQFTFEVMDGGKLVNWTDLIPDSILEPSENPTDESIKRAKLKKVAEYIQSFNIRFQFDDGNGNTSISPQNDDYYDVKIGPEETNCGFMKIHVSGDGYEIIFNPTRMMLRGKYIMNMYVEDNNNSEYIPQRYVNGKWEPDTSEGAKRYIATKDGNYYLKSNNSSYFSDFNGKYVEGENSYYQFAFFEVVKNKFNVGWQDMTVSSNRFDNVKNGSEFSILKLTIDSDEGVPFITPEAIREEVEKADASIIRKFGNRNIGNADGVSLGDLITNGIVAIVSATTSEVVLAINFNENGGNGGVHAGSYTAEFANTGEGEKLFSPDTTYDVPSSKTYGIYNLYQMVISPDVTYTSDGPNYIYNAEQQGASNIGFVQNGTKTALPIAITTSDVNKFEFAVDKKPVTNAYSLTSGSYKWSNNVSKDVGNYSVTITLNAGSNYTFTAGDTSFSDASACTSIEWSIAQYEITLEFSAESGATYNGAAHLLNVTARNGSINIQSSKVTKNSDGTYTIKPFDGDAGVTIAPKYIKDSTEYTMAVNAGTYSVSIDNANVDPNYKIVLPNGIGDTINISPATINIAWNDRDSYVYNGYNQGRGFASSFNIGGMTNTVTYNPATSNTVTIRVTNKHGDIETITMTVSGDYARKDVGGPYNVNINQNFTVSGQNAAGSTTRADGNYTLGVDLNKTYSITKKDLNATTVNVTDLTKIYDGTPDVPAEKLTSVTFSGLVGTDRLEKGSGYTVTATYDNQNVGTGKTVTFNIQIKDATILNNYSFTNNVKNSENGIITPATLIVTLNLRSGVATKIYDGNANYGGDGFSGRAKGQSSPYRLGNGFRVSGFVSRESDDYSITAVFEETGDNRSDYNAFVNCIGLGTDKTSNKRLVFTLKNTSSDGALNYTLALDDSNQGTLVASGKENATTPNKTYTLTVTSENSKAITITQKTIKPTYTNTAQSYANPDNTYNTDWQPVGVIGTGIVSADISRVKLDINNGWMGEPDAPKEYKQHTVIRGIEGNANLGAQLVSIAGESAKQADKDAYLNYTLALQPTLVIGYFVYQDGTVFEIGSLASLLIASYYYSISGQGGPFDVVVPAMKWHEVCSDDQYQQGNDIPTTPQEFADWDAYFNYLASDDGGNHNVFYDEELKYWGYYEVDDSAKKPTYTSFRLVNNIKGVFTQSDIDILNGMFNVTLDDKAYDWGYGTRDNGVLKNVLKAQPGDAVTILNSLFGNFTGTFDGNGYVIDGINLMGGISITGQPGEDYRTNAGFFATIEKEAKVSNLHLRNLNLVADGVANVGGLAGTANADVTNVSVHGMFNVTGGTNLGGVIGVLGQSGSAVTLSKVIALGTIYANNVKFVGGVVGKITSSAGEAIKDAVSMMYIWSNPSSDGYHVGGIVGGSDQQISDAQNCVYLTNSVWLGGNVQSSTYGEKAADYTTMYSKSVSGYGTENQYYKSNPQKGEFDVLDESNYTLDNHSLENDKPRESMRLCDVIDVYLLQYSLIETSASVDGKDYKVYKISESSWLVGTAKGTKDSPIIIANQQGVSLLRELRFATFKLTADVYMYSTYELTTFKGAFFGNIYNSKDGSAYDGENGYHIYIKNYDGTTQMFEQYANDEPIPLKKY